jgi:hypothetical protein
LIAKKLIKYFQRCKVFVSSYYSSGIKRLAEILMQHLHIDLKTIPKKESETPAEEYDNTNKSFKELSLTQFTRVSSIPRLL